MPKLVEPETADLDLLLSLSNAHENEIGRFSRDAFVELVALSFRTRMTKDRNAFLIALAEHAPEDAPNYRWFAQRFERFVYIDRVVVAASARKRGLGRLLYDDLMAAACAKGYARVCCEVNSDPPNPDSDAFHARLGFDEVGRAHLPTRGKAVRYLMREVSPARGNTARPFL
jgi:predicted GNAT superfamily acetyltransferase